MNKSTAKAAIVVGINKFKNYPSATLKGCVNDTESHKNILINKLGFNFGDVTVLLNQDATKDAIMIALKTQIEKMKKGELKYLYFSMSSHGSNQPTNDSHESDKLDEVWCPTNIKENSDGFDDKTIIVDNEIYDLFKEIPDGCFVECMLDLCHSGDSVRKAVFDNKYEKKRFLKPKFMKAKGYKNRGLFFPDKKKESKPALKNVCLWAACKDSQTAADAFIDKQYCGAFTKSFLDCFNEKKTRKELYDSIKRKIKVGGFSQDPQLEVEDSLKEKVFGEF